MNHQNFDQIINWLEAGAPERIFSMNHGVGQVSDLDEDDEICYPHLYPQIKAKPTCGSICCIAGYAYQQHTETLHNPSMWWTDIQDVALKFLGLPPTQTYMIPLFDPDYAPPSCTPQQAAEAMRDFRDNWNGNLEYNPWSQI